MKNLSLKKRLIIAFSITTLLSILLGINSLIASSDLHQRNKNISDTNWPKLLAINIAYNNIDSIAIALRNMMLSDNDFDIKQQTDIIKASRDTISQQFNVIESLTLDSEEKIIISDIKDSRQKYIAGQESLMRFIDAKDVEGSKEYLNKQLRPVLAEYKTNIKKYIDHQTKTLEKINQESSIVYNKVKNTTLILIFISLVFSVIISFSTIKATIKQLGADPSVVRDIVKTISTGDLTIEYQLDRNDESSVLFHLKEMVDKLKHVINTVTDNSKQLLVATNEIANGNNDLSSRTESQASSVEETSASMESLSKLVKDNFNSSKNASYKSLTVSKQASDSGDRVNDVVKTMNEITESSRKVGDIISVIDSIAFQTNILALNAAVEAARAAEHGKGFAVVATEVRFLANETAKAAKEIKSLITASLETIDKGSEQVQQAGQIVSNMVDSVHEVNDLITSISTSTEEQTLSVSQISEAVSYIDKNTQQNAAMVEEMAAAASGLRQQASDLVRSISFFKV